MPETSKYPASPELVIKLRAILDRLEADPEWVARWTERQNAKQTQQPA